MRILTKRWREEYWLCGLIACASLAASISAMASDERPVVLFVGTSLTAGYGLPSEEAFPALIQTKIDAEGLNYRVVNAGVSGDTSAGGRRRIDWLLQSPVSVLVLELGANDMLRGLDPNAMRKNLGEIIERARAKNSNLKLVIAGMRAAPNLGSKYLDKFEAVYAELAQEYNGALIPFLLEDVAARPKLNQVDGIHPTAEGHELVAMRVWNVLEGLLR